MLLIKLEILINLHIVSSCPTLCNFTPFFKIHLNLILSSSMILKMRGKNSKVIMKESHFISDNLLSSFLWCFIESCSVPVPFSHLPGQLWGYGRSKSYSVGNHHYWLTVLQGQNCESFNVITRVEDPVLPRLKLGFSLTTSSPIIPNYSSRLSHKDGVVTAVMSVEHASHVFSLSERKRHRTEASCSYVLISWTFLSACVFQY